MENNVNSSVNNNVATNTNPGVVTNSGVVNSANVAVNSTQPAVNNNGLVNDVEDNFNYKKFYIWSFVIVGIVVVVALALVYFLLNGSIENRNRLTCNYTKKEDGYTYKVQRYYTFDSGVMKRVYFTYTFEYDEELTDEKYNEIFDEIINNDTHGSTKYGLGTNISKEGNVVTITSFEPSYWNESVDEIETSNKSEGYTCE